VPGGITEPPCSWGYKYRDPTLQVGGVSDETVKYGREFCGDFDPRVTALAKPRSNCAVSYRPTLSSERVPHIKKPAIITQKNKSGPGTQMGSRHQNKLTN
jgi:hypothetical protein